MSSLTGIRRNQVLDPRVESFDDEGMCRIQVRLRLLVYLL